MFVETLLAGVNAAAAVFKLVVTVLIDCEWPEMPYTKKKTLLAPSEIKEIKHSLRGVTFAPHHILQYSGFKRLFRMTRSV